MKKIVFAITSLQLGGAERVLVDLVNRLKDHYDITIFTLYGGGEFLSQVSRDVKCISCYDTSYEQRTHVQKLWTSILMFFPFLWKTIYGKYIKDQYDVEIAFLEGPPTWILSCPSKSKKIAWIHNDLSKTFEGGLGNFWKRHLNKKAYRRYQQLVFVSCDNMEVFQHLYPDMLQERHLIYNYLDSARIQTLAQEKVDIPFKKDAPVFLSVCRLTQQKGLERLICVHKRLIDDGYFHYIYIIGDGPLRESILDLIDREGVMDTFILLGKKENPYPYMRDADYFLLASHYEGYGMVLVEAQILGKRILLTDTAAREAVSSYPNAFIMENSEEGIYQGILKILEKKTLREGSKKYQNENIIYDIIEMIRK